LKNAVSSRLPMVAVTSPLTVTCACAGSAGATTSSQTAASFRQVYMGCYIVIAVAYIICEPCIGTKDTACVDVCPVDCIHPRKDEPAFATVEQLFIHPDECIDCGACVPACPVEAIFALDETPEKWKSFIPVNSQFYQK
jgi:NAD-dependent dihydropyrimidine dehydrogenase PreA subunit